MKKHSFLLLASLIGSLAVGDEVRINSVDELIQLKDSVNSGSNYLGTTVFLDSDLDFAGKEFEPIGTYFRHFRGVFDGQGHAISNLAINPSTQYVGLFGYSYGLTIRNVILDSSCSITCSFSGSSNAYVGGIVGYCSTSSGPCTTENSVNMGSVSFTGSISGKTLYLGGITGYHNIYSYDSAVKNCANYGSVTDSGESKYSYMGGISGYSYGSSSYKLHIYNSLNYGTIAHSGTTNYLYLGGITGYTGYATIENCVSAAGKIESTGTATYNYIGSVVGYAYSEVSISYCYFTSELSSYNKYGRGTPSSESNVLSYDSATFELSEAVSAGSYTGTSLIDALNAVDYYTLREYSNWLLNKNKKAVTFTINGKSSAPISMSYQIMVLPSLASEGNMSFNGWYEDSTYATPLASYEVTSDTALYGKWEENTNSYTITLDTRREGISIDPITAQFGSVVALPSDSIRENCSVELWETDYGDYVELSLTIPAHNITLYAVWKCTHLKTPEDLVDFSKIVNNGADTYEGTTVFLDSDLDFTGKPFEPIGISSYNYFAGAFDGQGHVISNLAMNYSSSIYAGLFGYSKGLTVRNVILDSSCSIKSSISGSNNANVGGIVGYCYASYGSCAIENSVNMARVSFTGNINGYSSYLGGIAGQLYAYRYESTVKNCANYGELTHPGNSYYPYVGGIVGYSCGYSSTSRVYIYNSLNYGTLTHSGTTSSILYIGGVASYTKYTTTENCVSAGEISSTGKSALSNIGSIFGYIYTDVSVDYCYITSELSTYGKYGTGTPSESNVTSYDSTTFELSEAATVGECTGTSLISALNAYADTNATYSHWLLNKNNNTVTFTINGRAAPISMNYQIMVLPSLASEGNMSFDGWYEDSEYTTPLASYEVTSDTTLYSLYGVILTVTFDKSGGEGVSFTSKKVALNDVYGELPETTRTEYAFDGWFTEQTGGEKVESGSIVTINSDHTLYAQWTINQYTITFDFNNGTVSNVVLDYDTAIEYPENMARVGFTFGGWDSKPERMPAENITVKAQWTINQYTLTFDFDNGTVSSAVLDFDSLIEYPEDMTRVGFTFGGWDSKPERMPAENITVKAQWTITDPTECVEIVFSEEDLTEDNAKEIVGKFVPKGAKYRVAIIESGPDGTKAIVKFNNAEAAKEFVEAVIASSEAEKSGIKAVEFISGGCSFATSLGLSVLAYFLAYLLSF